MACAYRCSMCNFQKVLTMAEYTKFFYKLSEVSEMLGIPVTTINYWVSVFDKLDPPTSKGGQRRYRPEDIEMIKQIDVMMHDKGMQIEGANRQLKTSRVPYRGFKCRTDADAHKLLDEVSTMVKDNPRAVAMLKAVDEWVENSFSQAE